MARTLRKKKYLRKNTLRKKSTKRKYTNRRSIKRKSYKKKIKGGLIGTRCADNFARAISDKNGKYRFTHVKGVFNKSKNLHDYSIYIIRPFKNEKDYNVGLRFNSIQTMKSELMKNLENNVYGLELDYRDRIIDQLNRKKLSFVWWGNEGYCEQRYQEIEYFFRWIDDKTTRPFNRIFDKDAIKYSLSRANQLTREEKEHFSIIS